MILGFESAKIIFSSDCEDPAFVIGNGKEDNSCVVDYSLKNGNNEKVAEGTFIYKGEPGGVVKIWNFKQILNAAHEKNNFKPLYVEIADRNDNKIRFISYYASRKTDIKDAQKFIFNSFLVASRVKRIDDNAIDFIGFSSADAFGLNRLSAEGCLSFFTIDEPCVLKMIKWEPKVNGTTIGDINHLTVDCKSLKKICAEEADVNVDDVRLVYMSIVDKLNQYKYFEYFFDYNPNKFNIYFRNVFGCWELAQIVGSTKKDRQLEVSTGLVDGRMRNYDVDFFNEFTFSSGPLTGDEMDCFEQVLDSSQIYLLSGEKGLSLEQEIEAQIQSLPKIIITAVDTTTDNSNDGKNFNVIKFTYRLETEFSTVDKEYSDRIHRIQYNNAYN